MANELGYVKSFISEKPDKDGYRPFFMFFSKANFNDATPGTSSREPFSTSYDVMIIKEIALNYNGTVGATVQITIYPDGNQRVDWAGEKQVFDETGTDLIWKGLNIVLDLKSLGTSATTEWLTLYCAGYAATDDISGLTISGVIL